MFLFGARSNGYFIIIGSFSRFMRAREGRGGNEKAVAFQEQYFDIEIITA